MRYEPFDWYGVPAYYDIVFDPWAEEEASFVDAVFHKHAKPPARRLRRRLRALEPACGSGRVLAGLAARGWEVSGFDRSEGMVARARERLPGARISRQLMESFVAPAGSFDVAFNLVSTFRHLESDAAARHHVQRVAAALRPGGLFLLGLHLSDYSRTTRLRERWLGRSGDTHVVCNLQRWAPDRSTRTERARARLRVSKRGRERGFESRWTFRCYDEHELLLLVGSVPSLSLVALYGFDFNADAPLDDDDRLDRVLVLQKR